MTGEAMPLLQWLYALKLNLDPVATFGEDAEIPLFVRSRAYADKTLMTACGSWAELHRDVILYSKEVYVNVGGIRRRRQSTKPTSSPAARLPSGRRDGG